MRITIESGSSVFELCSGADDAEYTENLRMNGVEMVQVGQFLRAVKSKPYARGNTETTIAFTVTREHADAKTCEEYICEFHASIPKTGDLIFTAQGSGETRYKLSDAQLRRHTPQQIGVTSIHEFEFVGGDFSKVAA